MERAKQRSDLSVEYKAWNLMKVELYREGKQEGELVKLIQLVCKKIAKGCSVEEIVDMLEEEPELVRRIYRVAAEFAPEYDENKIYASLCSSTEQ